MTEETIVAIATAIGEGSIGIIRLSGAKAFWAGQTIFCKKNGEKLTDPAPRVAIYGKIVHPEKNHIIDEALLIYMPGPHSYTAEDVVELHLHGSTQSLKLTLELLLALPGIRLSEPGEFTQRAFLNGRLDLSQAEAVMGIIHSRTERSLQAAAGQLEGGLAKKVKEITHDLIQLIARLEVVIEYPEDSLEETELPILKQELEKTLKEVQALRKSGREGIILREGLNTAIIGLPNVGKSSLLNCLLGEERAIVTDIPGTTRDVIEESLSIGGIPIRLIDTAGIRETEDQIEKMGIDRSRRALQEAQFVLMVCDSSRTVTREELNLLKEAGNEKTIVLVNKIDLLTEINPQKWESKFRTEGFSGPILFISTQTGEGIKQLEKAVGEWVFRDALLLEGRPMVSNLRQIEALRKGEIALQEALDAIEMKLPADCILVDVREAWAKIAEISGQAVSDEIIRQIFSQFCLGK